jgi:hypothetical protein
MTEGTTTGATGTMTGATVVTMSKRRPGTSGGNVMPLHHRCNTAHHPGNNRHSIPSHIGSRHPHSKVAGATSYARCHSKRTNGSSASGPIPVRRS